jgi:hypothetical protein
MTYRPMAYAMGYRSLAAPRLILGPRVNVKGFCMSGTPPGCELINFALPVVFDHRLLSLQPFGLRSGLISLPVVYAHSDHRLLSCNPSGCCSITHMIRGSI